MHTDPVATHLENLHAGLVELITGTQWAEMLAVTSRFHRYSTLNTLAIYQQRPDATRVAGYRSWQALGRQVRRGETSIKILAPLTRRSHTTDPDTGEDQAVTRIAGFRIAHVFDMAQTDGEPLPDVTAAPLTGDEPNGLLDALAAQITVAGFDYQRGPIRSHPGANGLTDYRARTVTVRANLEPAMSAKTTAHELAHVQLHGPDRPERDQQRIEVEAESVAYVVCAAAGLDAAAYSFPYVGRWSFGDIALVQTTADRVGRCAREILTTLTDADQHAA